MSVKNQQYMGMILKRHPINIKGNQQLKPLNDMFVDVTPRLMLIYVEVDA